MHSRAVTHYQAVGREKALADFNRKVPPFAHRDLHVVCLAADRTIVANGGSPSSVGTSADQLKDVEGQALGKAFWDAAARHETSVRYRWLDPVARKAEAKVSYVAKIGSDLCSVGAYLR